MPLLEQTKPPLSRAMREGSMAEHTAAENASFTSALLRGEVNPLGYLHYLLGLRTIYGAIEEVGRPMSDDVLVAAIHDRRLERGAALDADISHWAGYLGSEVSRHSPAATAYAARIGECATDPVRYIAHHYTRYLGDLSGGRAIGRILAREYGTERGFAFYDFPEIPKPKPYKDRYRATLDALPIDEQQRASLVAEVKIAFKHNQSFFTELGGLPDVYRRPISALTPPPSAAAR